MSRWIWFFSLFVVIVCVTFVGYVYTFRAEFVSTWLSQAAGLEVCVKSCDFTGRGIVARKLVIRNGSGSKDKTALVVPKVDLQISAENILKAITGFDAKQVFIEKIKIEEPEMHIAIFAKKNVRSSNWNEILTQVRTKKEDPTKITRRFLIEKVEVKAMKTKIHSMLIRPSKYLTRQVANFSLKNLGTERTLSTKEASYAILKAMFENAKKT